MTNDCAQRGGDWQAPFASARHADVDPVFVNVRADDHFDALWHLSQLFRRACNGETYRTRIGATGCSFDFTFDHIQQQRLVHIAPIENQTRTNANSDLR
jgi:hypothetical protein